MNGIIVVGSNYGDREYNIRQAISFVDSKCDIKKCSEIYESPDFYGKTTKYLNVVLEIECQINEEEINSLFKEYEIRAGRDSERRKKGEVPIDIDIVIWEGKINRIQDYESLYFIKGYEQICGSRPKIV